MKIICSKNEFAGMVRVCERVCQDMYKSCSGCVFNNVCSSGGDPGDGDIMFGIEDICEIQEVKADG